LDFRKEARGFGAPPTALAAVFSAAVLGFAAAATASSFFCCFY
jgi:hypothetical protein